MFKTPQCKGSLSCPPYVLKCPSQGPDTAALTGTGAASIPARPHRRPRCPGQRRGSSGRCPRGPEPEPRPGPRPRVTARPSQGSTNTSHHSPPTPTHRSALRMLRPAPAAPPLAQPQPISAVLGPALSSQHSLNLGHSP